MFVVQRDSRTPLFLQIKEGFRHEIMEGHLTSGTRLPSSRKLSSDLGVSRITVTNAYEELEADGIVEGSAKRGIYVMPVWQRSAESASTTAEQPAWQNSLNEALDMRREEMMTNANGSLIRFDAFHNDLRNFPIIQFSRILSQVLREDGPATLDYESPEGYLPLRQALASHLLRYGIRATEKDIILTTGGRQAIDLVTQAIIRPGDSVVVENPTFGGAITILKSHHAQLVGVPLDADGMRTDLLEEAVVKSSPRLIYTVPTFHNPTGTVMSAGRRKTLVTLAYRYDVPVLEDDYIREIHFGGPIPPPVAAFDQYNNVIHIGTFSKTVMPSLRLGYVVARGPLYERIITMKKKTDDCCSSLLQRALCMFMTSGAVHRYWKKVSRINRHRQAAMIASLKQHFPAGTSWMAFEGGLAVWVGLPAGVPVTEVLHRCWRRGVAFVPGERFFVEPNNQPFARLNFAVVTEDQIERGIRVMAQVLREQ